MGASIERGQSGEALAERYLLGQGLTILERGWRSGALEVDLIAQEADELVIVEVKTRSLQAGYPSPIEAVDRRKQRNLIRAANAYLIEKRLQLSVRYDVVGILLSPIEGEVIVEHVRSAFYPSMRS